MNRENTSSVPTTAIPARSLRSKRRPLSRVREGRVTAAMPGPFVYAGTRRQRRRVRPHRHVPSARGGSTLLLQRVGEGLEELGVGLDALVGVGVGGHVDDLLLFD